MASVNATGGVNTSSAAASSGSKALGKNEFLKLLTAQLANQDPLAPTDNQAFIAQLAQFSSVEQAEATNSRLDSLILAQAANNQTTTASLVGKDIVFKTDSISLAQGSTASFQGQLAADAVSATATITDENGKEIAKIKIDSPKAGTVDFTWNGKDDKTGAAAPAGKYKVKIVAADKNGDPVAITQQGRGRATSLSFEDGVPKLVVNGVKISMADVLEIAEGITNRTPASTPASDTATN